MYSMRSGAPALWDERAGHAAIAVPEGILFVGGHPTSVRGELFRVPVEQVRLDLGRLGGARYVRW
jgi:hypothetical protein